MSVRVFAPAKINLTLKVGLPRADGLHPIESVVAFADVGDWIEAEKQPDSPVHIRGPFGVALAQQIDFESDPVSKAFRALERDEGAAITLEKYLPIASGIGGGSTDAAATLKALNLVWARGLSEVELMSLGAGIGADVPVCVAARPSWMTGIGDVIEPISLPPLAAVLVNPLLPLPTANVYRQFDQMRFGSPLGRSSPPRWESAEDAIAGIRALGNDLAAPARALMPAIAEIETTLAADRRVMYAGLSGSGATCFALVADAEAASALASELSARRRDWWVRATRFGAA